MSNDRSDWTDEEWLDHCEELHEKQGIPSERCWKCGAVKVGGHVGKDCICCGASSPGFVVEDNDE